MYRISFVQRAVALTRHRCTAFLGAGMLAAGFCLPVMALEVSPAVANFESRDASAVIQITHEGAPVAASAVNAWQLLIDDHDYNHMIDVSVADGALTVRPTEATEIGSYRLLISTDYGEVSVAVYTPLRGLPESLENRASAMGITVEELNERLGMTRPAGRESIDLNLPPVYYTGQKMKTNIPLAPGRTAKWTVNDEPVSPGNDLAGFEFLFTEPGVYVVGYSEFADGTEVASGYDVTTVIGEPPVKRTMQAGARIDFTGPAGYTRYDWIVNGLESGHDPQLSHTFEAAGDYEVIVRATDPDSGRFRQVTYLVTVE